MYTVSSGYIQKYTKQRKYKGQVHVLNFDINAFAELFLKNDVLLVATHFKYNYIF